MANYNYIIADDIITALDMLPERATVKSSHGKTCDVYCLFTADNEPGYICVSGESCGYGAENINETGKLTFSMLLALHAALKLEGYGYLKCECSQKPNTVWYYENAKQLVGFDKNGDYFIICED